jgi:tRNA(adenine34) deaminase
MCAGAMVQARLARLVYAIDDPKAGAAGSVVDLVQHPQLNHQIKIRQGVMAAEAETLLQEFFRGLRDGRIPHFSEGWRQRKLAEKRESM